MRAALAGAVLALSVQAASAVAPDECEQQRAAYPRQWSDVSADRAIFTCSSHYSGGIEIMLGKPDREGRRLMSIVAFAPRKDRPSDTSKPVYRIWLDKAQADRLQAGKYFATAVRQESSCWIRGSLSADDGKQDTLFFMDNANPRSDGLRGEAGPFYNRAPRFSVFQGDAYTCERAR
jgi:hypothetical protein